MLIYMKRYTRAFIRAHPDWLFVFGDNLDRDGFGGQAQAARGEPNAVGIPTKRSPRNDESAFLTDADFEEWEDLSHPDRSIVELRLTQGRIVVWPLDDIGTGLAKLGEKAPAIAKAIADWKLYLETLP